jgi:hypothetical protein
MNDRWSGERVDHSFDDARDTWVTCPESFPKHTVGGEAG